MSKSFFFAHHLLDPRQIFFTSPLSLGFINVRPALPGHVLLIPQRIAPRFLDLQPDELTDLVLSSRIIARALETRYAVPSLTLTIQDGPQAGQTVPHTHMHLLPRRPGDFRHNDQVYDAIDKSTLPDPPTFRTIEEMEREALELKAIIDSFSIDTR